MLLQNVNQNLAQVHLYLFVIFANLLSQIYSGCRRQFFPVRTLSISWSYLENLAR